MRFQDHMTTAALIPHFYYDHDGECCWYRGIDDEWVEQKWVAIWTEWYLPEEYLEWLPD